MGRADWVMVKARNFLFRYGWVIGDFNFSRIPGVSNIKIMLFY